MPINKIAYIVLLIKWFGSDLAIPMNYGNVFHMNHLWSVYLDRQTQKSWLIVANTDILHHMMTLRNMIYWVQVEYK